MNSIVRIATASNVIHTGNPLKSAKEILAIIDAIADTQPDVIMFPKGTLIGGQCGDLLKNHSISQICEEAIGQILTESKHLNSYIILPGSLYKNHKPIDAFYLIHQGEVLAIVDHFDPDFAFFVNDVRLMIYPYNISSLMQDTSLIAQCGCDILLIPTYEPAKPLSLSTDISKIQAVSNATACAIAVSNGGIGDTSFPYITKGYTTIYECGTQLSLQTSLYEECVEVCDVDGGIIHSMKAEQNLPIGSYTQFFSKTQNPKNFLMRKLSTTPYLPEQSLKKHYLHDLFNLQVASLAKRMQNISIAKLIIGVSGGLDSTLALLVAAATCDALSLPRENVIAVTMQGLGTSTQTYDNAITLMQGLGCTIKDIPIKQATLSHLADIGHNQTSTDITYENAQARERTQILLDLANMLGGIVVGTGDLSELALGFCTFGGDALASYNVNSCLTKTVIREMVAHLSTTTFDTLHKVLTDILHTPISPELLPLDDNGAIEQKTESILGEYELHDFFLYYFIKYIFTPAKILEYAKCAFSEKYEPTYITQTLRTFLKRFVTSQFKRSCSVDSANITDVNLNGFTMPSDLSNSELFSSQI